MKACVHCLTQKPLSEFYAHPATRDRLQSWCKCCLKESVLASRAKSRTGEPDPLRARKPRTCPATK